MAQHALTDGDLLKRTLRTTLVMVGATALWLGALTGIVMATTGSPASPGTAESKADKVPGAAPGVAPGVVGPKSPVNPGAMKGPHRVAPGLVKPEQARTGETI
jgi:hypothetical protein